MCTVLLVVMNRGLTVMNQKINDSRLFGCSKVKKSQQKSSVLEVFRKRWSRHLCQNWVILQQFLLMSKELLLRIGIPPFVCQKASPSFEKSTPKEESSSTKTMQAHTQPKKQGSI
ncbi:unnamed protein product [Acanthoscelides obtectus]|uniref:Uncharacterized protein n=1 Tax=Acanthoscelides obtectus TaxID=200917 RepID=A0A9P0M1D1_ACAOB|nr:unnamed protein product [Acanthoscelides obtectus]CAK1677416.1 hypothetical protein AOBTE_LOCUS31306 [Acanthoscelides obtectus]